MNPFVPEQIDVKAIVDYTDESGNYHSQPVFGFFYRDYQRITVYNNPYGENMDDPDNWRWDDNLMPFFLNSLRVLESPLRKTRIYLPPQKLAGIGFFCFVSST